MPKTSHTRHRASAIPSAVPPTDINGCSVTELARLSAEVLRLHLASRHLVTSGSKATMAKRLYDALNQPTTSLAAPPSSTLTGDTPPSTNQLTTTIATYPPALQAQLSSLMAQFLQYATPPVSTSLEAAAPGTARTTSNLSLASTVHAPDQPQPSTDASISFSTLAMPPRTATVTTTAGHSVLTSLQPPIALNAQPPIPTAHAAITAAAPMYPAVVQPPISTLLPPSMPTSSWTTQQPPYHQLTMQPPAHLTTCDTLPPVPAQIRQKIIQGWTLQATGPECSGSTRSHPCMAHSVLDRLLVLYQSLGVAPSTRRTYKTGVRSYLLFCDQFTIPPFPASSLTLCYFCSYIASHVSHKTIKVYLSGIRLEHLERGELLCLLCKGIKRSQ